MTLQEQLNQCDILTHQFFNKILPLLEQGKPYAWLPVDAGGLARRLSASHSYCYAKLESLRAQGILAKGSRGYYCPALFAKWIRK